MDGHHAAHGVAQPSLALLPNGRVFAAGNQYASSDARSELYDPATGIWSAATTQGIGDIALLGDGTVLIAAAGPQVYDPTTNTVAPARPIARASRSRCRPR